MLAALKSQPEVCVYLVLAVLNALKLNISLKSQCFEKSCHFTISQRLETGHKRLIGASPSCKKIKRIFFGRYESLISNIPNKTIKMSKDDVHTTVTKTHRSELVLLDLPQDRIYGFVPNGQSIKTCKGGGGEPTHVTLQVTSSSKHLIFGSKASL